MNEYTNFVHINTRVLEILKISIIVTYIRLLLIVNHFILLARNVTKSGQKYNKLATIAENIFAILSGALLLTGSQHILAAIDANVIFCHFIGKLI